MNASIASRTLRTLAAWVAVGLFFFPIYYWTSVAFKYGNDIFSRPPNLFHFTPTFDNFQKVFGISLGAGGVTVTPGGGNFFMAPRLWDSIVVATLSTLVAIVIATLASYALSRMQFRGRHHFVNWVLSTRMMPPVAVAVPMFFIYKGFGLLDTFTGMVLIHALMNLPLAVLLMKSFFDDIPAEIDESAIVDGASRFGILRHVMLPLARPALGAAGTLAFVGSVLSETVGGNRGIGFLMLSAGARNDAPTTFAGLFSIAIMGMALYALCALVERRMTRWAFRGEIVS